MALLLLSLPSRMWISMKIDYHLSRKDLREKNYKASASQKLQAKTDRDRLIAKTIVLIESLLKHK